jgi:hypothetical protein
MSKARAAKAHRRLVRAAGAVLEESGVAERVRRVQIAVHQPRFEARFRAMVSSHKPPVQTMEEARGLAQEVLREMDVELADVLLTFGWDGQKTLQVFVRAAPEAAALALAAAQRARRSAA